MVAPGLQRGETHTNHTVSVATVASPVRTIIRNNTGALMFTGYSQSQLRDGVMLVAMRAAGNWSHQRSRERESWSWSISGGSGARVWLAPVAGAGSQLGASRG